MVIGISQSAVVEAYGELWGEDVKIDCNYAILKNVRYKNGATKALIVGLDQSLPDGVKEDLHLQVPAIDASDLAEEAADADATAYTRSSADEELKEHTEKEAESTDGTIMPKYKIVEQGMLELTNHHNSSSRRPKQLIVHVYLDKIASAAEIDLHVSENKVEVGSKEHKYKKLDLQLPYPIKSLEGKASFDKAKRSLILRLPLSPE